jgi:hypothetical protein
MPIGGAVDTPINAIMASSTVSSGLVFAPSLAHHS